MMFFRITTETKRLCYLRRAAMLLFLTSLFVSAAQAQLHDGALAIKTNGNLFRSGGAVRVELIALERVYEPFSVEVSYHWRETVKERDEEGKVTQKEEERVLRRERSPAIESMSESQLLVLDDEFHFGEASFPGRYSVEVAIFRSDTKEPVTKLRTCVYFKEYGGDGGCATELRSLKRVASEQSLVLAGTFSGRARYTAVLLDGNRIITKITNAVFASAANELTINSDAIKSVVNRKFDLLIHDRDSNHSSTISGVTPVLPY